MQRGYRLSPSQLYAHSNRPAILARIMTFVLYAIYNCCIFITSYLHSSFSSKAEVNEIIEVYRNKLRHMWPENLLISNDDEQWTTILLLRHIKISVKTKTIPNLQQNAGKLDTTRKPTIAAGPRDALCHLKSGKNAAQIVKKLHLKSPATAEWPSKSFKVNCVGSIW